MSAEHASSLCVLCRRRPVAHEWRPFCSRRCQLQDLAHWADATYSAPGDPVETPDEGARDTGDDEPRGHF